MRTTRANMEYKARPVLLDLSLGRCREPASVTRSTTGFLSGRIRDVPRQTHKKTRALLGDFARAETELYTTDSPASASVSAKAQEAEN